ncbi:MAG: hypothetical protein M5U28_20585 [Sandaracinaceae bacterium]|nr:hypothetical protein [Sandaracinaceae bacterium]
MLGDVVVVDGGRLDEAAARREAGLELGADDRDVEREGVDGLERLERLERRVVRQLVDARAGGEEEEGDRCVLRGHAATMARAHHSLQYRITMLFIDTCYA